MWATGTAHHKLGGVLKNRNLFSHRSQTTRFGQGSFPPEAEGEPVPGPSPASGAPRVPSLKMSNSHHGVPLPRAFPSCVSAPTLTQATHPDRLNIIASAKAISKYGHNPRCEGLGCGHGLGGQHYSQPFTEPAGPPVFRKQISDALFYRQMKHQGYIETNHSSVLRVCEGEGETSQLSPACPGRCYSGDRWQGPGAASPAPTFSCLVRPRAGFSAPLTLTRLSLWTRDHWGLCPLQQPCLTESHMSHNGI